MKRSPLFALLLVTAMTIGLSTAPQGIGARAQGNQPPQGSGPKSDPTAKPATEDPTYIIGSDDVLDISVWKEPEISRQVPVRPDGKISLPLLNDVQAAGLTPMHLQAQVTEKLRKFLTEPQVTVIVAAINSRRVYIMGEVNKAGPIPLLANMTVLQAITTAGGLSQFANSGKIRILRTEGGKQAVYAFNYKEVLAGKNPEQNIVLKPGDSIVVP
jgi:polysaccharide export outer membrane protein